MWYLVELDLNPVIRLPVFNHQWIHLLQCWQDLRWTSGDESTKPRKLNSLLTFSKLQSIGIYSALFSGGQGSCCKEQRWRPRASTASALDSSLCSCQGCTSPKLLPTRTEHSRRTGTDPWLWDRALLEQVTSTWKFCLFLLNSSFFPQLQHSFAPLLLFPPLFLSQASLTEFSLCQLQTNTVSKTKFFQEINEKLEKYQKFTSPYIMRRVWKTCKQKKRKTDRFAEWQIYFLKR